MISRKDIRILQRMTDDICCHRKCIECYMDKKNNTLHKNLCCCTADDISEEEIKQIVEIYNTYIGGDLKLSFYAEPINIAADEVMSLF